MDFYYATREVSPTLRRYLAIPGVALAIALLALALFAWCLVVVMNATSFHASAVAYLFFLLVAGPAAFAAFGYRPLRIDFDSSAQEVRISSWPMGRARIFRWSDLEFTTLEKREASPSPSGVVTATVPYLALRSRTTEELFVLRRAVPAERAGYFTEACIDFMRGADAEGSAS